MAEKNTVKLKLTDQNAEKALAVAIQEFALWREQKQSQNITTTKENDLPDIMVRTQPEADSILKVLTFSDSQGANKFLSIWEDYATA